MKRAILQNTLFGFAALALGGFAAWVLPDSPETSMHMASAPVLNADTAADSPLATAYRAANGEQRWLLVLSAAEHAAPEEFSTLIRMVRDEPFAVRLVAERWAERDPAGMFSSLYADFALPETMPGTLPERHMLSEVLTDRWATSDLPAAIKALTDAPEFSARNEMRWRVANQACATDAEAGLRLWAEWGIHNYGLDTKRMEAWIVRDPRHAAEVILGVPSGGANEMALRQVGATWAQTDPAGALRFAAKLESHQRGAFGEDVMRTWAQSDPQAAADFVAAETDPALRNVLASRLVASWGWNDPAAALAWSQENLKGRARTNAISEMIGRIAQKDLTAASQLVADMNPGTAQNQACASVFQSWFEKGATERDAAFDWLASLPDPAARTAALDKVTYGWIYQEPDAVRDFIAGPHGDLASPQLINTFAQNQAVKNPEAAMAWASGLPADHAAGARRSVLQAWLWNRPEAAADYVRGLPAGPERESALWTVTQALSRSPAQAEAWVRSLSTDEQKLVSDVLKRERR